MDQETFELGLLPVTREDFRGDEFERLVVTFREVPTAIWFRGVVVARRLAKGSIPTEVLFRTGVMIAHAELRHAPIPVCPNCRSDIGPPKFGWVKLDGPTDPLVPPAIDGEPCLECGEEHCHAAGCQVGLLKAAVTQRQLRPDNWAMMFVRSCYACDARIFDPLDATTLPDGRVLRRGNRFFRRVGE